MNKKKENFTPGPWVYKKNIPHCVDMDNGYGLYKICEMDHTLSGFAAKTKEEMVANGYLIAAAPEMFRLLSLLEYVCRDNNLTVWTDAIGNVLKQARGEK